MNVLADSPRDELLNSATAKCYPHNSKSKGKYE